MSRHVILLPFTAAILAVALLFPSLAAAVNNDDSAAITTYYDECLCWNTSTAEMCAATNETNEDACDNFTRAAMWYWVPVIAAAAIAMLLFPCVFACGRACNCCGGRGPSFGCCCPDADLGRRVYSKVTVVSAKVLAVVLVVTLIGMTAWSIASHQRLADSVSILQRNFTETATLVKEVRSDLGSATLVLDDLINVPLVIVSADAEKFLYDAGNTTRRIASAVKGLGFFSFVALITGVLVLILGGCGVIGLPLTLAAMCFALCTAIYLVALIAIGIPAQLTAFACDDGPRLNSSTRFLYQALNVEEITAEVSNASRLVEFNYVTYLCDNVSLASLCASGKYNCDASFCGNRSLDTADATYSNLVGAIFMPGLQSGRSIVDCAAAGTANCSDAAVASAVVMTFNNYDWSASKFSRSRNGDLSRLASTAPIDEMIHAVCNGDRSLRSRLRSPAGFHVVMSLTMVFGLIVGLYGAKRFRQGPRDACVETIEAAEPPMAPYPPMEYRGERNEAMVDIVPGVPVYGIPMEHTTTNQAPVTHVMDVAIEVDHDPHVVPTKSAAPY